MDALLCEVADPGARQTCKLLKLPDSVLPALRDCQVFKEIPGRMHWRAITHLFGILLMLYSLSFIPSFCIALLFADGQWGILPNPC